MARVQGFCLFDTAIGACGIAWSQTLLSGVQLPDGDEAATRARMRRRFPGIAEVPGAPACAAGDRSHPRLAGGPP